MTAACGEESRLLALLCQPATIEGAIAIPEGLAIWGLDSGVRHSVAGADYGSVRAGAFIGYRMIAEIEGLKASRTGSNGHVAIDDPKWRGYLANVTPGDFETHYAASLPERIEGAEFLRRFHGTTDAAVPVRSDRGYAVRTPAAHPIYEHHRVRRFSELLARSGADRQLELLGELMYQSHSSYSACGLGSEETDMLVRLVREAGPKGGLFGARITGGGSGGTVAVLGQSNAASTIEAIADRFADQTGYRPHIFSGSSPGSAAFGHMRLKVVEA